MNVQNIIDEMPPEVLTKVERAAESEGVSVQAFVETQLRQQLTEEQLELIAGGEDNQTTVDLSIRGDYDTGNGNGRVGGSARIRF